MSRRTTILVLAGLLSCLLALPSRLATQAAGQKSGWHENVFFGIHNDLHATALDTELGRELTPEVLRARLLATHPDWIQSDCKGHPGYTSWPTKVGSTSPGVVKDALRIYRDVTRELGIKLGVHYSGVVDVRAIELHPEWGRVDSTGKPDKWATCRLHGYDEQLMIPQMMEIIDTYDVDGFWVDGENWAARPCWCSLCKAEFTRRTGIREIPTEKGQPHWDEWLAFHRDLFVEHVTRYTNAIHARKPACQVVSNWMYSMYEPEAVKAPIDYLSGDIVPWEGVDLAAVQGRILDARRMSWDLMAWGYINAGESNAPLVFKPAVHLEQELSEPVALGGAVMIDDTPQRSGWLTGWHYDIIAKVGDFCRARQETCFHSQTLPQAAVLFLPAHFYAHNNPLYDFTNDAVGSMRGALQALLETHHSTDVLPEDAALECMNQYKLLVIPEETPLDPPLLHALEDFARQGGYVLVTGADLASDYAAWVGASPRGKVLTERVFLPLGNRAVPVGLAWQPVSPAPGTQVIADRLREQDPVRDLTDQAVVTRRNVGKGAIIAVYGPIFRNYYTDHAPSLREFIGRLVDGLDIHWAATVTGPPQLEMILRQKEGKLLVNLINRGSGEAFSANRNTVENLPPIENVVVRIFMDHAPRSVSMVPPDGKITWEYMLGFLTVKVAQVDIHRVLVIE
jgi:hypothetical protein